MRFYATIFGLFLIVVTVLKAVNFRYDILIPITEVWALFRIFHLDRTELHLGMRRLF
jgi:hypothetical protein